MAKPRTVRQLRVPIGQQGELDGRLAEFLDSSAEDDYICSGEWSPLAGDWVRLMKEAATGNLEESTRLLKAFADPVRLRLLNLLGGDGEVCVCHLHEALGLPQPTVSRHLAYLRKHKLVLGRKAGLWVHYQLAKPGSSLHEMLIVCVGTSLGDPSVFQQDRQRLARVLTCRGEP